MVFPALDLLIVRSINFQTKVHPCKRSRRAKFPFLHDTVITAEDRKITKQKQVELRIIIEGLWLCIVWRGKKNAPGREHFFLYVVLSEWQIVCYVRTDTSR